MSFGILPTEDIKSCGVSADKSTDQNVADVPSGEKEKELCELAQTKKRLLDIGDELIAKLREYTIPAIAESVHQLDEVDPTSWSKAIQSEKEELALQKAISIIDKVHSVDPSDYMCFSCKYGNRVGMPCKECRHDYEDKYTPINKYGTIPRLDIDLISKESAICAIENTDCELSAWDWDELTDAINKLPSADVVSREEYNKLLANSIWESEHIGKMLEYQNKTEPSGDLISRADALEQMAQAECGLHYEDCEADKCFCSYIQRILDLPTADRPKGEWVEKGGECVCSVCGNSVSFSRTPKGWVLGKFCQSCGAIMKGGAE